MNTIYICLIGYLIGSIPCGFLLTKYCCNIDLRKFGSASTGTTNVLRTGHKKLALMTLLLDVLKGFIFSSFLLFLCDDFVVYSATFCCVLGHIYPVWLKFNGGKGAATAAGIFLSMSPIITIVCGIIWGIVAKVGKISSIASLSFFISFTIIAFFQFVLGHTNLGLLLFSIIIMLLLFFTHLDNIKRLINHEESKITVAKKQ